MAMAQSTCWPAVQFIDTSLRDFDCPICLRVLQDPFLTECCGHHFCNACVKSILQSSSECPVCKAQPVYGIVDKRFKRELNDAKIYCSLRSQGCEWTGPLSDLTTHLSYGQLNGPCQYVTVTCSHKNCNYTTTRHKMKKHFKSVCKYRPFTCPHCKHKGVYADVYHNCPECAVVCPYNCAQHKIKRSQLNEHFKVCSNVVVSCPFSGVGCGVTMKRGDQESHIESHVVLHQALIVGAVTELREIVAEIDAKCKYSFTQVNSKISFLERKYVELQRELSTYAKSDTQKYRDEVHERSSKAKEIKQNDSSQSWITGFKSMAKAMKKNNWRLYLTTMAEVATQYPEPVCPVVMRITGYQQSAQEELCSPEFWYTSETGDEYTLQLVCHSTTYGMTLSLRNVNHHSSSSPAFSLLVTMLNQLENHSHIVQEIDFISCMELRKPDMSLNFIRNSTIFLEVSELQKQ